jgi:hypothetical protein
VSDLQGVGAPNVDRANEQAVRFRFVVTWSSLLNPAALASPNEPVATQKAAPDSSVQWAMVIPKLAPPAAATFLLPATAASGAARFAAPRYVAPKYEASTGSMSLAVKLILIAAAAMLLAPGWTNNGSPGARAVEIESTMSESGWARESADQARQLVLYRASLAATDYRLEFTWRVNPQGVACVFRAKDNNNFYAVRIKPFGSESSGAFSVERFAVYHGIEKSRGQRVLTLPGKAASLRAAMNAAGPMFQLYLDGTLVSQWIDSRLTAGGLGFLEEAGRPAELQSVRISFPRQ